MTTSTIISGFGGAASERANELCARPAELYLRGQASRPSERARIHADQRTGRRTLRRRIQFARWWKEEELLCRIGGLANGAAAQASERASERANPLSVRAHFRPFALATFSLPRRARQVDQLLLARLSLVAHFVSRPASQPASRPTCSLARPKCLLLVVSLQSELRVAERGSEPQLDRKLCSNN